MTDSARKRLTLVACILGSSVVFVDSTVVNVALPAIRDDLGGGLALQQWVVDAYLLTLGALILIGGSLGDLFGERRVFGLGVALFGATSVLCALAPDGPTLIVARGLQGVAGALLTPAALAVVVNTFEGEERGAAIGTWTAWSGIATVVGPLLGGWLVEAASWRWVFLINVPLTAATLALVLAVLPRRAGRPARVDVVGGLLCTVGLGGPVFALIEEGRLGWAHPAVVAGLAVGAAVLPAFVAWERRTRDPMLPLGLFARRNFTAANLETLGVYAGLSTLTFFLVLYLQQLAGWSPLRSALALLPVTIVLFVLSPRIGRLSTRYGPRLFMAAGPLACAAGAAALLPLGRRPDYWTDLLPPLLAFAVGLALTVAPLTSTVLADVGEGDAGIASAVNNATARVAGLLGIAVVGAAVAGPGNDLDQHGFRAALAITAGLLAAGGAVGFVGIVDVPREATVAP